MVTLKGKVSSWARRHLTAIVFSICFVLGLFLLMYGMGLVWEPKGWHALYVGMGLFLLGFPFSIALRELGFSHEVIKAMWYALAIIIAGVVAISFEQRILQLIFG